MRPSTPLVATESPARLWHSGQLSPIESSTSRTSATASSGVTPAVSRQESGREFAGIEFQSSVLLELGQFRSAL